MIVAIAGGHGQIAQLLARQLSSRGDEARALIRNPEHAGDVDAAGARAVECDLESASVDELAAAIEGADAVVFAAGAGPGSGAERKETVDYGAAVLLIDAAKRAGIDRYVMVSAISADPDHSGDDVYDVYIRAKGRADAGLAASGLRHTIVRPGGLTDDPGTGKVAVGENVDRGEVPRADVAAVVAAALADDATISKSFILVGGDTPIDEALRSL